MDTGFTDTGRIFGRRADVANPRAGPFGLHGHRIDFCESAVLNHFAIKAFCTSRNNKLDPSLLFHEMQNAFIAKWFSTVLSQQGYTRLQTKHAT
jgi:hypothetical protein